MLSPFRLSKPILVALVLAVFQEGTRAADVPLQRRLPNHPVIVFESDDWGEVSADSAAAVRALAHEGYLPDSNWAKDCAETVGDLERLYRVLERHVDARRRHPVFTANLVVSDPDFEAIEKSGFTRYSCRPVSQVFPARYAEHGDLVAKWKEGLARRVFVPQLHARE